MRHALDLENRETSCVSCSRAVVSWMISKLKENSQDPVPQSGINRILVYDNSGTDMTRIYDSDFSTENTPEDLRKIFERASGFEL